MIKLNNLYAGHNEDILLIGLKIYPVAISKKNIEIPRRQGALRTEKNYLPRTIVASFALNGKSAERNAALYHELIYWASYEEPKPLVVDEQPDRYYLAELVDASEIDLAAQFPECSLTFECVNPFAYSTEIFTIADTGNYFYDGNIPVSPVIEYLPSDSAVATLRWTVESRFIEIVNHAFVAGRKVFVDNANCVITDGGSTEIMKNLSLYSDWLRLVPGLNNCILTPGAKLQYRKVWL